MRGLCLACAAIVLPGFALAEGIEGTRPFTTANGYQLSLTPPAALNCDQVQMVLGQIDDSGYRDGAPIPPNPADRPLYEYELDLAAFNYERCVLSESGVSPAYDVFRRGN